MENLNSGEFDLTEEEINAISALDRGLRFNDPPDVSFFFFFFPVKLIVVIFFFSTSTIFTSMLERVKLEEISICPKSKVKKRDVTCY